MTALALVRSASISKVPFLSHAKRGVHPPALLEPASRELFDRMWQAADGQVSVMTIAPEIEGAIDLIAEASQRGICVSLGHSDADLPAALAGIRAGARHATHTFNAMRALDHRDPGHARRGAHRPKPSPPTLSSTASTSIP